MQRTITTVYEPIKITASKSGVCKVCGKKMKRSITFEQTLNPWNKNKDGSVKTYNEIWNELVIKANKWKDDKSSMVHDKCNPNIKQIETIDKIEYPDIIQQFIKKNNKKIVWKDKESGFIQNYRGEKLPAKDLNVGDKVILIADRCGSGCSTWCRWDNKNHGYFFVLGEVKDIKGTGERIVKACEKSIKKYKQPMGKEKDEQMINGGRNTDIICYL